MYQITSKRKKLTDAELQSLTEFRDRFVASKLKDKILLYLNNVNNDSLEYERSEIMLHSLMEREEKVFDEKIIPLRHTLIFAHSAIAQQYVAIKDKKNLLEKYLLPVFITENTIFWLNSVIREEHLRSSNDSTDSSVLHLLKQYRTQYKKIRANIDSNGFFKMDCSDLDGEIKTAISAIVKCKAIEKAIVQNVRSLLDSLKLKGDFPIFIKEYEVAVREIDTFDNFSSTFANKLRKKKNLTPTERVQLAYIERNEKRGYALPDYNTIEPDEDVLRENSELQEFEDFKKDYLK